MTPVDVSDRPFQVEFLLKPLTILVVFAVVPHQLVHVLLLEYRHHGCLTLLEDSGRQPVGHRTDLGQNQVARLRPCHFGSGVLFVDVGGYERGLRSLEVSVILLVEPLHVDHFEVLQSFN